MLRVPSTGGVELAVHDLGGPPSHTAPVVLFAHATGLNARVWEPMAAALRDGSPAWPWTSGATG